MATEIRSNGKIATLRVARKQHDCKECPNPIDPGNSYWEVVYGGGGLRNTKYPNRVHAGVCFDKHMGGK